MFKSFLVPLFYKKGAKYFLQKATYKLELNHGCGFCAFVSLEVGFSLEAAH